VGRGTPAPGEGFALTIATRECAKLNFENSHDRHDVTIAVASIAAKRASVVGRGPTLGDVRVALNILGLLDNDVVSRTMSRRFRGLAHSYSALRRFTDAVTIDELTPGSNDVLRSY
jgi:hypothetical protein